MAPEEETSYHCPSVSDVSEDTDTLVENNQVSVQMVHSNIQQELDEEEILPMASEDPQMTSEDAASPQTEWTQAIGLLVSHVWTSFKAAQEAEQQQQAGQESNTVSSSWCTECSNPKNIKHAWRVSSTVCIKRLQRKQFGKMSEIENVFFNDCAGGMGVSHTTPALFAKKSWFHGKLVRKASVLQGGVFHRHYTKSYFN